MRTRVLAQEEWPRLAGTEAPIIPGVLPGDAAVVAVEDGDEIVAAMTVLRAMHFEGVWVHPEHRNGGVVRGMLRLAKALAELRGSSWVFSGASDDRMRDVLTRLGGVKLPMDTYMLGLGGDTWRAL